MKFIVTICFALLLANHMQAKLWGYGIYFSIAEIQEHKVDSNIESIATVHSGKKIKVKYFTGRKFEYSSNEAVGFMQDSVVYIINHQDNNLLQLVYQDNEIVLWASTGEGDKKYYFTQGWDQHVLPLSQENLLVSYKWKADAIATKESIKQILSP